MNITVLVPDLVFQCIWEIFSSLVLTAEPKKIPYLSSGSFSNCFLMDLSEEKPRKSIHVLNEIKNLPSAYKILWVMFGNRRGSGIVGKLTFNFFFFPDASPLWRRWSADRESVQEWHIYTSPQMLLEITRLQTFISLIKGRMQERQCNNKRERI